MNQYETVFILTPVLSDVQMKEAVEKFKAILTQEGAEIINEENWGLKKLAYPIQKKSTGFYQLIEFKARRPPSADTESTRQWERRSRAGRAAALRSSRCRAARPPGSETRRAPPPPPPRRSRADRFSTQTSLSYHHLKAVYVPRARPMPRAL